MGVGTAGGTITAPDYGTLSVTVPAGGLTVPMGDASGTATSRFRTVENGIFSANALKAEGTRIIGVGIAAHAQPGSIANLTAISGPEEGSDYFIVPFDSLEGLLTDLAVAGCATLSITKNAEPRTYDHVGQTIAYTYTVKNTSPDDGFTLHDITVHDDQFSEITNCTPRTLAPGESATCTATHCITQDDLNAGSIVNTAVATGETPNDDTVTSPPDEAIVTALQNAAIRITKSHTPDSFTAAGQTIHYTYVITNTGNVPLADLQFTDTRIPGPFSCAPVAIGGTLVGGPTESAPSHALVTGMLAKPELPEVPVTG